MKRIDIVQDLSTGNHKKDIKILFNQYYVRLVYFCSQILNDKNQAEDVAQETFIKFWDSNDNVSDDPIAIKNFLYSTAKNACLNILRHHKVKEKHVNANQILPIEESILNNIIKAEVIAEINQAISTLPQNCEQIFRMSYFENLKNQEIADLLKISINTVKTQKQRALKVLRVQLKPEIIAILIYIVPHIRNIFY